MGMYDSIYLDKNKLPLSKEELKLIPDNTEWQTKDLECNLDRYYIQDDNTVLIQVTDGDGELSNKLEPSEIHGFVFFYSYINEQWFEFMAKFTDGKLIKIHRK